MENPQPSLGSAYSTKWVQRLIPEKHNQYWGHECATPKSLRYGGDIV